MASPKRKTLAQSTGFDSSKKIASPVQVRKKIKAPQDKRLVKLVQARQGVVLVYVVEQRNELQDAWANAVFREFVGNQSVDFGPAKGIARIWRRDPKQMNHAAENAESGYLRRAMLTIQDDAWTAENKLHLAEAVRDLLNNADDPSSQNVRRYIVPDDFDETPEELCPLDEYMLFTAIHSFIQNMYDPGDGWNNWYTQNADIADDFFRRPYPYVARYELGYPFANLDEQNGN